ncbi:MAG: molecular chaperone [Burkholderiales bacterium]
MRLADLARYRQAAYRLLGEALRSPENERVATLSSVAAELREHPGPLADLAVFPEWLEFLRAVARWTDGAAAGLDETYVRLFAVSSEGICSPFASQYLAAGVPAAQMAAFEREYARAGLAPSVQAAEPPDHVAVAFDFMAHLCAVEASAWERGDRAGAANQLELETGFLERSLCSWLPEFARSVAAHDAGGFYAAATKAAATFAAHDLEMGAALASRLRQGDGR